MLNVAVVMGRMVTDPEIRHTPNSIAVTNFVLAVDRSYVKSGTERQTDFIDVVAWRGTAEFVCKHFRKGQMMAVHGAIQTRTYTDKDGNKRKAFEIVDQSNIINQQYKKLKEYPNATATYIESQDVVVKARQKMYDLRCSILNDYQGRIFDGIRNLLEREWRKQQYEATDMWKEK